MPLILFEDRLCCDLTRKAIKQKYCSKIRCTTTSDHDYNFLSANRRTSIVRILWPCTKWFAKILDKYTWEICIVLLYQGVIYTIKSGT